MGGWNAFPGGRMSGQDDAVPLKGKIHGAEALEQSGPKAAHAACALRELFEETGLLVVDGKLPENGELEKARSLLLESGLNFGDWLKQHKLSLDLSRLGFAGRWVTPPLSLIRFDATFFLLNWPVEELFQPSIVDGELTAGEWIRPQDAIQRWQDGEVLLAQPTLETIRILDQDGVKDHGNRLWQSQAKDPDAPRVIEFRPSIRVIPLASPTLPPATHTNALLLADANPVLVDPGSPWDDQLEGLKAIINVHLEHHGGRLQGIWLTHHHNDHTAGAEALRKHYKVPILAHAGTMQRLQERGITVDEQLHHDQRFILSGKDRLNIRVLHTPGHASGHLCFFEEESRTLICGDMVTDAGMVVINPPDGSMGEYLASLEQLIELEPQVLLPGHGSMIRGAHKVLEEVHSHRLWRENKLLEVWQQDIHNPQELMTQVYGELKEGLQFVAYRQMLAHLEHLEETGRISSLPAKFQASLA